MRDRGRADERYREDGDDAPRPDRIGLAIAADPVERHDRENADDDRQRVDPRERRRRDEHARDERHDGIGARLCLEEQPQTAEGDHLHRQLRIRVTREPELER